jgi:hypothetical protein
MVTSTLVPLLLTTSIGGGKQATLSSSIIQTELFLATTSDPARKMHFASDVWSNNAPNEFPYNVIGVPDPRKICGGDTRVMLDIASTSKDKNVVALASRVS